MVPKSQINLALKYAERSYFLYPWAGDEAPTEVRFMTDPRKSRIGLPPPHEDGLFVYTRTDEEGPNKEPVYTLTVRDVKVQN